jgi:hypothetical protein
VVSFGFDAALDAVTTVSDLAGIEQALFDTNVAEFATNYTAALDTAAAFLEASPTAGPTSSISSPTASRTLAAASCRRSTG